MAQRVGASEITVTGLASDAARLAFAADAGLRTVVVDPAWDREARITAVGAGYDVALDVSGSAQAMAGAPDHLRRQGTFVLAGLLGRGGTVAFATDDLVYREIRIQPVLAKDDAAIRSALATVLADPALAARVAALTTHVFPLERTAEAIGALSAGLEGFVKAAVAPAT